MRLESSVKAIQIRGYDTHEDNYSLTLRVEIEGDMALITGLLGKSFYKNFDNLWEILALEYGIAQLYGTVMVDHAKVIKRLLSKRYNVRFLRKVINAGRTMILVRTTKK